MFPDLTYILEKTVKRDNLLLQLLIMFKVMLALFVFFGKTALAKADYYYTVTDDGDSLGTISLKLFGTSRKWQKIAEHNKLKPPYRIVHNQKLSIPDKPQLTTEQGAATLLQMWRRRLERKPSEREIYKLSLKEALDQQTIEAQIDADDEAVAKTQLLKGEELFKNKKFKKALTYFNRARTAEPELISAWLYEIRTLKILKEEKQATELSHIFLKLHEEFADLPMFKGIEN